MLLGDLPKASSSSCVSCDPKVLHCWGKAEFLEEAEAYCFREKMRENQVCRRGRKVPQTGKEPLLIRDQLAFSGQGGKPAAPRI